MKPCMFPVRVSHPENKRETRKRRHVSHCARTLKGAHTGNGKQNRMFPFRIHTTADGRGRWRLAVPATPYPARGELSTEATP